MGVNVTLETVGELMMNLSTMRLAVTLLTLGYFTMPLMTGCAVQIGMLGMICLKILVNSAVT